MRMLMCVLVALGGFASAPAVVIAAKTGTMSLWEWLVLYYIYLAGGNWNIW